MLKFASGSNWTSKHFHLSKTCHLKVQPVTEQSEGQAQCEQRTIDLSILPVPKNWYILSKKKKIQRKKDTSLAFKIRNFTEEIKESEFSKE